MHFESKGFKKLMLFPNVKITPELAKDLLTLNTDNRPVKNPTISLYTNDMKTGKWEFTGDVINISLEGKLINGQHRLLSIVNSGTTQVFHIQTGLRPEAFNKMDIGKVRTGADTLAMQGYSNYSIVTTVVKYVSMYNANLLEDYITLKTKSKFSNQDIADEAAKLDRELLQESARMASRFYARYKFMDSTTVGPLYYIFAQIDSEAALNFFDLLSSGDGISSDKHPSIFLLRNKLIASASSGSKITLKHRYAIVIKAWNAYRKNKPMGTLKYNEQDEFPKPL